ncbi:syntaphilin [Gadus morhua]|uniref:Syntaphilin-like n=1 Tax=Gadus morhua TaxID=8049 RepID=A0A8C5A4Z8_GADMO|nr:syntaphilin-like [Gadus morhua]XP_030220985.1 syntaphilin-like [Gadus morhua]
MSLTPGRKASAGQHRRSAATSGGGGRYFHGDASNTNTYPGRVSSVERSPATSTPRRQTKQTTCSDNHGIRPPAPEQYLTPLQQKEVCIRHLRARLRDNVDRLQNRDCELDDLRSQLYRMQEDWIEEECHRVEAQLALKDARREILHLQDMVESVKTNLGGREHQPPGPQAPAGLQGPRHGGRSRSCGCSPAGTLSRGTPRTRLSSEALHPERGPGHPDAEGGFPPHAGQKHLLLEAALLSEQKAPRRHAPGPPPTVSCSATYERLCSVGAVLPVSHSCHTLSGSGCRCGAHTYLPHHHLFLHLPQGDGPPVAAAAAAAASDGTVPMATAAAGAPSPPVVAMTMPVQVAERKPEVRSQACSPTMTWLSEEGGGEELSVISSSTGVEVSPLFSPFSLPVDLHGVGPGATDKPVDVKTMSKEPLTFQPQPVFSRPPERQEVTILEMEEESDKEAAEEEPPPQLCHWSRYFLVDLLALAVPVVPTMAWLCRRAPRDVLTTVPIGSMLRGCCAVALYSLRCRGAARGPGPINMNGATPI